jgi:polar amino acid transport system substrate-binding protein
MIINSQQYTNLGTLSNNNNSSIFGNSSIKNDSGINSLADLSGKTVETQKDSSALAALKGDNKTLGDTFAKLVEVADYNTGIMDLKSGACDAVALDIGVAQYQVTNGNNTGLKILNESISSEQYGIGFKLGNDALKDKVQATLDEMFEDGTVEKIAQKYDEFGVPGSLIQ